MGREYYPKPLGDAIVNYERADTPGLLKSRQNLAREVVRLLNNGNEQDQQMAVVGLLEAIELRILTYTSNLRADFEERLNQIDRAT